MKKKDFDFDYLSKNALIDACAPGNPFMPTLEENNCFLQRIVLIGKTKNISIAFKRGVLSTPQWNVNAPRFIFTEIYENALISACYLMKPGLVLRY